MKLIPYGILLLLFLIPIAQPTLACTIFNTTGPSTHYFASNEDWTLTNPVIQVHPGNRNNYGYLVFGWDSHLPSYPQGGLNEHGLCLDWAALSSQPFKGDPGKKSLDEDIMYKILKKCRNVSEVINLVSQFNCPEFAQEHLLVADRSGNSCVIEWSNNQYVFIHKKSRPYQVITNFSLNNHKIGWYPCQRFQTAETYLREKATGGMSITNVRDLLKATHQEGEFPTIYSYIIDTSSLEIYVYFNHDYSHGTRYNFNRLIKKGEHRIKLYQPPQ